jgi:hypothetical protein
MGSDVFLCPALYTHFALGFGTRELAARSLRSVEVAQCAVRRRQGRFEPMKPFNKNELLFSGFNLMLYLTTHVEIVH